MTDEKKTPEPALMKALDHLMNRESTNAPTPPQEGIEERLRAPLEDYEAVAGSGADLHPGIAHRNRFMRELIGEIRALTAERDALKERLQWSARKVHESNAILGNPVHRTPFDKCLARCCIDNRRALKGDT